MIFGYARVSTEEQNLDLQINALRNYGVDKIFEEKKSAAKKRPQLNELMKQLRPGDTLVIWKLDRLGRTMLQLILLAEDFDKRGINFVSLKENLDTTTAMGKFTFHVFCALAQMEREIISERTKAGLEAAQSKGRKAGRPKADPKIIKRALKMYKTNEFAISEILEATGISRRTLYNYINREDNKEKG